MEAELARISREMTERHDFEIETMTSRSRRWGPTSTMSICNHVHLLCSAPPKVAPSEIVRIYESITTVQMFRALPELKKRTQEANSRSELEKELWGGKFWTGGFYVSTVGQRGGYAALTRYIQNQGKKPEDENLRLLFSTTDAAPEER